jgi:hypothetical protein
MVRPARQRRGLPVHFDPDLRLPDGIVYVVFMFLKVDEPDLHRSSIRESDALDLANSQVNGSMLDSRR